MLPLFRATCVLLGIWGILSSVQWLADMPHWQDGRALGWDLQRLRRGKLFRSRRIAILFAPRGLTALACLQISISVALIVLPITFATTALLGCFALTTLLLALRAGLDGADKMVMVVATGALLQSVGIWSGEQRLFLAGELWTGGQLTIAYFASGASKLLLAPWRQGEALGAVLGSFTWGHRWAAPIVRNRRITKYLAWTIMLVELFFPLTLMAPFGWLCAVLVGFLMFHLAIAVTMGLNHYSWAFLAAYPSVLLVGQWLRSALGLN